MEPADLVQNKQLVVPTNRTGWLGIVSKSSKKLYFFPHLFQTTLNILYYFCLSPFRVSWNQETNEVKFVEHRFQKVLEPSLPSTKHTKCPMSCLRKRGDFYRYFAT